MYVFWTSRLPRLSLVLSSFKINTLSQSAPQLKNSHKQIDRQPNDVRTEPCGCLLKLNTFSVPFFDPYKKPNGGNICRVNASNNDFPCGKDRRGRRGEEPIWQTSFAKFCGSLSAVPSPGHKKAKNFKLNQGIAGSSWAPTPTRSCKIPTSYPAVFRRFPPPEDLALRKLRAKSK